MKRLFISQPMNGLTDEQILKTREEIKASAESIIGEPVDLIDSFILETPKLADKSVPIWYLGKSIMLLAEADVAYFGGDWENARGCKIEYEIADKYGIQIIEE